MSSLLPFRYWRLCLQPLAVLSKYCRDCVKFLSGYWLTECLACTLGSGVWATKCQSIDHEGTKDHIRGHMDTQVTCHAPMEWSLPASGSDGQGKDNSIIKWSLGYHFDFVAQSIMCADVSLKAYKESSRIPTGGLCKFWENWAPFCLTLNKTAILQKQLNSVSPFCHFDIFSCDLNGTKLTSVHSLFNILAGKWNFFF